LVLYGHTVTVVSGVENLNSIKDTSKLGTVHCSFKQPEGAPTETGIHFHITKSYHPEIGNGKPGDFLINFDGVHLNKGVYFLKRTD